MSLGGTVPKGPSSIGCLTLVIYAGIRRRGLVVVLRGLGGRGELFGPCSQWFYLLDQFREEVVFMLYTTMDTEVNSLCYYYTLSKTTHPVL